MALGGLLATAKSVLRAAKRFRNHQVNLVGVEKEAWVRIVKQVEWRYFSEEIECPPKNKAIPKSLKRLQVYPLSDEDDR